MFVHSETYIFPCSSTKLSLWHNYHWCVFVPSKTSILAFSACENSIIFFGCHARTSAVKITPLQTIQWLSFLVPGSNNFTTQCNNICCSQHRAILWQFCLYLHSTLQLSSSVCMIWYASSMQRTVTKAGNVHVPMSKVIATSEVLSGMVFPISTVPFNISDVGMNV